MHHFAPLFAPIACEMHHFFREAIRVLASTSSIPSICHASFVRFPGNAASQLGDQSPHERSRNAAFGGSILTSTDIIYNIIRTSKWMFAEFRIFFRLIRSGRHRSVRRIYSPPRRRTLHNPRRATRIHRQSVGDTTRWCPSLANRRRSGRRFGPVPGLRMMPGRNDAAIFQIPTWADYTGTQPGDYRGSG